MLTPHSVLTVSILLGSPDILVGGPVESLDVGAEVILHVSAALVSSLQPVELGQQLLQRLPGHGKGRFNFKGF